MDIKKEVAEKLVGTSEKVKDRVLDFLIERELEKRTSACLKVIEKITELEKSLAKESKPDMESYDLEGNVTSTSFSKERVQSLRKLREEREKLDGALKKALENNDFSRVLELGK